MRLGIYTICQPLKLPTTFLCKVSMFVNIHCKFKTKPDKYRVIISRDIEYVITILIINNAYLVYI